MIILDDENLLSGMGDGDGWGDGSDNDSDGDTISMDIMDIFGGK